MMKIKNPIILLLIIISYSASGQFSGGFIHPAVIVDGDTLPLITLPVLHFYPPKEFSSRREERRYTKMVRDVKKVYPYARLAGIKLEEYNRLMADIPREKDRDKLMKKAEDELRAQFEEDLKKLTFSQGKILIKLVDRETGNPSYALLKDLRGSLSAIFWQSLGRIFGYNLKTEYDAVGDDKMIEDIILRIEAGAL